jgi:hypothetical protein
MHLTSDGRPVYTPEDVARIFKELSARYLSQTLKMEPDSGRPHPVWTKIRDLLAEREADAYEYFDWRLRLRNFREEVIYPNKLLSPAILEAFLAKTPERERDSLSLWQSSAAVASAEIACLTSMNLGKTGAELRRAVANETAFDIQPLYRYYLDWLSAPERPGSLWEDPAVDQYRAGRSVYIQILPDDFVFHLDTILAAKFKQSV